MASAAKIVKLKPAIEPELKDFIDEVLVPILVRGAMREIAGENPVAPRREDVAQSAPERDLP
ncbi:MAG: hypothetical protein ACRD3B_00940 [Candidatus Sulfotelmatobacter sp.]